MRGSVYVGWGAHTHTHTHAHTISLSLSRCLARPLALSLSCSRSFRSAKGGKPEYLRCVVRGTPGPHNRVHVHIHARLRVCMHACLTHAFARTQTQTRVQTQTRTQRTQTQTHRASTMATQIFLAFPRALFGIYASNGDVVESGFYVVTRARTRANIRALTFTHSHSL